MPAVLSVRIAGHGSSFCWGKMSYRCSQRQDSPIVHLRRVDANGIVADDAPQDGVKGEHG